MKFLFNNPYGLTVVLILTYVGVYHFRPFVLAVTLFLTYFGLYRFVEYLSFKGLAIQIGLGLLIPLLSGYFYAAYIKKDISIKDLMVTSMLTLVFFFLYVYSTIENHSYHGLDTFRVICFFIFLISVPSICAMLYLGKKISLWRQRNIK